DPALSALVVRLLARRPRDRPQSASEVAAALAAISSEPRTTLASFEKAGWKAIPHSRQVGAILGLMIFAVFALAYFLLRSIIHVFTSRGELVIETDDPNIEVTIRADGAIIYDKKKERSFLLTPGEYEVLVSEEGEGGIHFPTKKFTITRGGKAIFTAHPAVAK